MKSTMLIVEDDDVMCKTIAEVFEKGGLRVLSANNGEDAVNYLKNEKIDIALIDFRLPGMNGLELLKNIKEADEGIMVIVMTAHPDVKMAISAMKAGAYDYINKPFELEELKLLIDKALETHRLKSEVELLRYQKRDICDYFDMVGNSNAIREVKKLITTVAKSPKISVLIQGETGTGKELIANAIHCYSGREKSPFIKLNCSAIPDTLLESEMFGYEKGAFTDAKQSKKGLFELADGGTIFLDEIGDMDIRLQPKLLQVLENQTFRKVGGVRDIHVDVRVVAATNKNLEQMVKEKKFRDDLYYRLKVMVINTPPLRERKDDIIIIAEHFIKLNNTNSGKYIKGVSAECREILLQYPWPGNIRELKNVIERACILTNSDMILPSHLPEELRNRNKMEIQKDLIVLERIEDVEREHILKILRQVNGNKSTASKMLGISRFTLREKLKKYGIEEPA
jgi:DNA-binding NtrC family response regulator